jgi:hypothetical protein
MPSTKTKNFIKKRGRGGGGEFINIVEEYPGYYSVNTLHKKNSSNKEILEDDDNELLKPIISQLLTSGDYHVPSYLTLANERDDEDTTTDEDSTTDEEEEDEEKLMPIQKENIIITITPVEKCKNDNKVIEEDLYNALVDSAEGLTPKKIDIKSPHTPPPPYPKRITKRKKKITKKKGAKKTKRI